ncbi:MAG: hypothetical protein K5780_02010 [Alphaproteobacteria bacterium]|nr:hypothetical protein [Alphaproteobacteria bacterium]
MKLSFFEISSEKEAIEYLKAYMLFALWLKEDTAPENAISTIFSKAKEEGAPSGDYQAKKDKMAKAVRDFLGKHYEAYFIHDSPADTNRQTFLQNTILDEYFYHYDQIQSINIQHVRDAVYGSKYPITEIRETLASQIASIMENSTYSDDKKRDEIYPKLDGDMPKAIVEKGDEAIASFKKELYEYFTRHYANGHGWTKIRDLSRDQIAGYCFINAWVPFKEVRYWEDYCVDIWKNTAIPAESSITTRIQNVLKNVGRGKTIKAKLKSEFNVSGTSALVNEANTYPVTDAGSDYADFKISDDGKTVDVLNYTSKKVIDSIINTDAITTYGILKTQADDKLGSAVGGLVPSGKVNDMKSEIKTAQSEADVADAVCSLLEDSKSNATAQNYVARIYRGREVNNALGVVGNNFKDMIDANIAYDTLKYLRHDMTLDNVMKIIVNVKNFVNKLDGTDEQKSEAISSAIGDALNGFPAKDIADIINRII